MRKTLVALLIAGHSRLFLEHAFLIFATGYLSKKCPVVNSHSIKQLVGLAGSFEYSQCMQFKNWGGDNA